MPEPEKPKTPEEMHKNHSDICEFCKRNSEQAMLGRQTQKSGWLEGFRLKDFLKSALQTGIMGVLLLLAFNIGQLQTYYAIDYYNQVCAGGSYFSNQPTDSLIDLLNLGSFEKPVAINNTNFTAP